MSQLLRRTGNGAPEVFSLNLGANRIGSGVDDHFRIVHPSVSNHHCEIALAEDGLHLRDCKSAKGTFVDGKKVKKAVLKAGQTLRLGEVELEVESTEVAIRIPHTSPTAAPQPVTTFNPQDAHCPRHPDLEFTHRCTQCSALLCDKCISRVRRQGGIQLILCNRCNQVANPLDTDDPKSNKLLVCLRHPNAAVSHRCTNCQVALCRDCVTRLRQGNGRIGLFCPICNHPAEPANRAKPDKKRPFGEIVSSLRLPWTR